MSSRNIYYTLHSKLQESTKDDWYYTCNDAEQALFRVKSFLKEDSPEDKALNQMIIDLNSIRMDKYKTMKESFSPYGYTNAIKAISAGIESDEDKEGLRDYLQNIIGYCRELASDYDVLVEEATYELNESEDTSMTLYDYIVKVCNGEIDKDVADKDIDMLVALCYDVNDDNEDLASINKFIEALAKKTKIVKDNGNTLVCDFSSAFKPYNDELKEFFDMDNSEFDEDEAYYEAVTNLEALLSGNASDNTYNELTAILNGEKASDKNNGEKNEAYMKQLYNNASYITSSYLNGMNDDPDNYKPLTKEQAIKYVREELFDILDDGQGSTNMGDGIADFLKELGDETINNTIIKCAEDDGILAESIKESVEEGKHIDLENDMALNDLMDTEEVKYILSKYDKSYIEQTVHDIAMYCEPLAIQMAFQKMYDDLKDYENFNESVKVDDELVNKTYNLIAPDTKDFNEFSLWTAVNTPIQNATEHDDELPQFDYLINLTPEERYTLAKKVNDKILADRKSLKESTDSIEEYLADIAQEDWDAGQPYSEDDFDEFVKIGKDDGYDLTEEDFNRYFELYDMCRYNENSNLEESANNKRLDTNKIAKFIKSSVDTLQNSDYTNTKYDLDNELAIFVGWSDGYDAEDTSNTEIHSKENPTWAINATIAKRNDYDWTDLDYLTIPYYKDGEVFPCQYTVSPDEDYNRLASTLVNDYEDMRTMLDNGELLTESVDGNKITAEVTFKGDNGYDTEISTGKLSDGRYFLVGNYYLTYVSDKDFTDIAKKFLDDQDKYDDEFQEVINNSENVEPSTELGKTILSACGVNEDEALKESDEDIKRDLNIEPGSNEEEQIDSMYDYLIDVSDMKPIAHIYTGKGNSDPGLNIYEIRYDIDDQVLVGFGDYNKAQWCDILYHEDGEPYFVLNDNEYSLSEAMRENV